MMQTHVCAIVDERAGGLLIVVSATDLTGAMYAPASTQNEARGRYQGNLGLEPDMRALCLIGETQLQAARLNRSVRTSSRRRLEARQSKTRITHGTPMAAAVAKNIAATCTHT